MIKTMDFQHPSVYAEVRGKYARPPPLMQKTSSLLAPKENMLISRPSTSGSLKPRSSSFRNHLYQDSKPKEQESSPLKQPRLVYRSLSNNAHVTSEKNEDPVYKNLKEDKNNENKPVLDDKNVENIEENKLIDENQEENKKIENEDDFLRDGLSYISGLTTSSQKRYIEELENLLRQEKLRRIQLEESLKKVTEKTS